MHRQHSVYKASMQAAEGVAGSLLLELCRSQPGSTGTLMGWEARGTSVMTAQG